MYTSSPTHVARLASKTSFLSYVYSRLTSFQLSRENSGELIAPFANDVVLLPTHSSSTYYRTRSLKIGLRFWNALISSIVIEYTPCSVNIFRKCHCEIYCINTLYIFRLYRTPREFRVDFPFRKLTSKPEFFGNLLIKDSFRETPGKIEEDLDTFMLLRFNAPKVSHFRF